MREGFSQATQREYVKEFFKQTLGESQLNDELAFAYADAFESASDVVAARIGVNLAPTGKEASPGSTLISGASTAISFAKGASTATSKTKIEIEKFLLTMHTLFENSKELVSTLWNAMNKYMVAALLAMQLVCAGRNAYFGVQTFFDSLGTFNQFQAAPGVLIGGCRRLIDLMLSVRADTPDASKHVPYRETQLGPLLLTFMTRLGGWYVATGTGWYILKQLSFAFNDGTKRITVKKDAIQSVVTRLGTPLSLDELVDNADEVVAKLTGSAA